MATVALVPSLLGLRPSFYGFADALRDHGHDVRIVDVYDGASRATYEQGRALRDEVGIETLLARALERAQSVPDGFVAMGLSFGALAAAHLASHRTVRALVMIAGAAGPDDVEGSWPAVPAQIHVGERDELVAEAQVLAVRNAIEDAGGSAQLFRYPTGGHLFMDPGLPQEYDQEDADLLLERVLTFLEEVD